MSGHLMIIPTKYKLFFWSEGFSLARGSAVFTYVEIILYNNGLLN